MLIALLIAWGTIASLLAAALAVSAWLRGAAVRRLRAELDEQQQVAACARQDAQEARRAAEAAGLACDLARQLAAAEGEREAVLAAVPRASAVPASSEVFCTGCSRRIATGGRAVAGCGDCYALEFGEHGGGA